MDRKSSIRKLSHSPQQFSNRAERYLARMREEGNHNTNDIDVMLEYMSTEEVRRIEQENDPNWYINNLEADLRGTDWILQKARDSEFYAQNLYAALCNNDFQKIDVVSILKNETWSCSWRYAGGIVADMRESGDYIDWYCSGIRGDASDEELASMSPAERERYNRYVNESVVTDEIQSDLKRLGWQIVNQEN